MFALFRTTHTRVAVAYARQTVTTATYTAGAMASFQFRRHQSTAEKHPESLNVAHSRFIAEGDTSAKWKAPSNISGNNGLDSPAEDYDSLSTGRG